MPSRRLTALLLAGLATTCGCAGGRSVHPEPALPPPPTPAWRPAEAMAMLLEPPADGVSPVDDRYLDRTASYRFRMADVDSRESELRRIERVDPGGRRTWLLDGGDVLVFRVDMDDDGSVDQSQYFGPEGLYAIAHRFAGGRRVQRVFWPPGQPRIVEIRDAVPPYPGVWWRTTENPFATGS